MLANPTPHPVWDITTTDRFLAQPTSDNDLFITQPDKDLFAAQPNNNTLELARVITPSTSQVQVYPNSTKGPLNISFTPVRNAAPVSIVLVDSNGNVVKEITHPTSGSSSTILNLDLTGYKKGIYMLQINIDGTKSQHRVVVE
jgi:hypothetical protein